MNNLLQCLLTDVISTLVSFHLTSELNSWPWYVDDSVLKCKRNRGTDILNHLNSIEPEYIKFTMEEEENNRLASLDLEMNVNRKQKRVEFGVHYKKTNTNITIKKQSNHTERTKQGVIRGYAERAKAYCDPEYLQNELVNIQHIFEDNGYSKKEIAAAMKDRVKNKAEEDEEKQVRGMVVLPNIHVFFSTTPHKIVRKHGFRVANKTDGKVRDLIAKAKTPLGSKNGKVVYNIPCKCVSRAYTGETDRMWCSREVEHKAKVRLTLQDVQNGKVKEAQERMNDGDGGLAKHATLCSKGIDWENAKIIGREPRSNQRKYLEGIETLKLKNKGIVPLNAYNRMEHWQSVVCAFEEESRRIGESDVR